MEQIEMKNAQLGAFFHSKKFLNPLLCKAFDGICCQRPKLENNLKANHNLPCLQPFQLLVVKDLN